jgi:outer membrane biogenesis lipoprotein LolB
MVMKMNSNRSKFKLLDSVSLLLVACSEQGVTQPEPHVNSPMAKPIMLAAKTQSSRPETGFPIQATSKEHKLI